ncbi:MAG: cytochrome c-type biogenesis protein CcmH [Chloroflexi bacterium]|nr:cytochrome c-type biogenesis protein CcmH [Chloroflexota bacterium]
MGLLAGLILPVVLAGCSGQAGAASLEKQAQEIYRSLMCPLCPGQTIAESQSELSAQMRAVVWEKLEQGETKEEILQFFVERYGEAVLAAPPKSGLNLVVWLAPIAALVVGGMILWRYVRKWATREKRNFSESTSPASDITDDDKYRKQLDKELKDFGERGFR